MKRLSLVALILMFVCPAFAADDAGMIKNMKGSVRIERGGLKIPAQAGMPVRTGDRIVTGADGSVGITLRDNTLLSAGPKSTLVLNQFTYNSSTNAGKIDASVKRGTLAVASGKIAKNAPDAVKFRTPAAILGVRGTEFVIDAGAGEEE
jgi:hypothetical protein